jgi:hypothetical protein
MEEEVAEMQGVIKDKDPRRLIQALANSKETEPN